jgi:hypothetical protein
MTFESLITSINPQYAKHMKQHTLIQTITPDKAKVMLRLNKGNRPIRQNHVKKMAEDMKAGAWQITHQGIAFNKNGELIDGQHRLNAIIESGKAVTMAVTTNCECSSFTILDQGIKRSVSDITGWDRKVADVLNLAMYLSFSNHPTADQMFRLNGSDIYEAASRLINDCSNTRTTYSSAPVRLAAIINILQHNDYDFVLGQYRALVTMDFRAMTKCLQSFIKQTAGKKMTMNELFARALVAFNKEESDRERITVNYQTISNANTIVRNIVKSMLSQ